MNRPLSYDTEAVPAPSAPVSPSVKAQAERRWHTLLDEEPDLRPAVDLQRALLGRSLQLHQTLRQIDPPAPQPGSRWAERLTQGVPLFPRQDFALPIEPLTTALVEFCEALERAGAGASAAHITAAIRSERLDAGSLLKASWARADCDIRDGSIQLDLAPDLLWLVAELAIGPYAYFRQQSLKAMLPAGALSTWGRGYCPFCGSWPALAERRAGQRVPRCSLCAASWDLADDRCVYCGEHGEAFSVATPDASHPDRQLETCRACGGYLKVLMTEAPIDFLLVAVEDLATSGLDKLAMEGGFHRPLLKKILS